MYNKSYTVKEAFGHFGVEIDDVYCWSAVNKESKTVVMTIWTDQLSGYKENKKYTWNMFDRNLEKWTNKKHNRSRIEHLQFCKDHCHGEFKVILCKAKDVNSIPRETESRHPWTVDFEGNKEDMVFEIKKFDPDTGEIWAVQKYPVKS